MAASQTMRYYEDPVEGTTDFERMKDFVGTYELTPGKRRIVTLDGNHLYLQRDSSTKTELEPEAGDLFFRTGIEGRILFHRSVSGLVDAIYDRRNNEDVQWKRVN